MSRPESLFKIMLTNERRDLKQSVMNAIKKSNSDLINQADIYWRQFVCAQVDKDFEAAACVFLNSYLECEITFSRQISNMIKSVSDNKLDDFAAAAYNAYFCKFALVSLTLRYPNLQLKVFSHAVEYLRSYRTPAITQDLNLIMLSPEEILAEMKSMCQSFRFANINVFKAK